MADHIDKARYAASEASGRHPIDLSDRAEPKDWQEDADDIKVGEWRCVECGETREEAFDAEGDHGRMFCPFCRTFDAMELEKTFDN